MSDSQLVGKYHYEVCSYHTDARGKLFIHHLFNFLQDVAHRHANSLGFGMPQLMEEKLFWVLSRLSIEIDSLPAHEDIIEISTWVKSLSGVRSEREFSISLNDETIIRASSMWFCLSSVNHRPAAIPKRFQEKMVANDIYAVPGGTIKVERVAASKDLTAGVLVTSQHSDIDMVNHVNNAAYVRWVMDEYRGAFPNAEISEFSINYLQEVLLGDTVRIYHSINDNTAFVMIENTSDQEPICRVRIGWN